MNRFVFIAFALLSILDISVHRWAACPYICRPPNLTNLKSAAIISTYTHNNNL